MERPRLTKLVLEGFKSFPDRTELPLEKQVTAIVGPNGSGKSNLVDALLWVIGEQSPSLLRLKNMSDVIFAGSAHRPPSPFASVTLTLKLTGEEGELEVSRAVLRAGHSEYRIGGKLVRLRDVEHKLWEFGLGRRGYSVIEQGRVAEILSWKPQQRRVLLEEAAGIAPYKAKRREAELKIALARENLSRVEDLLREVRRRHRQLKKQAKTALRHSELSAELRRTLATLYQIRISRLKKERSRLATELQKLEQEIEALDLQLQELEKREKELLSARSNASKEFEHVSKRETEVRLELERLQAFVEGSERLKVELQRRHQTLKDNASRQRQARLKIAGKLEALETRYSKLAEELKEAEAAYEASKKAEREESSRLEQLRKRIGTLKAKLVETTGALRAVGDALAEKEREREKSRLLAEQWMRRIRELKDRIRELEQEKEKASSLLEDIALERVETARELKQLSEREGELTAKLKNASQDAEGISRKLWALERKIENIETALKRLASPADVAQKLLGLDRRPPLLGELMALPEGEGDEAALMDLAWGELLTSPVVPERTFLLWLQSVEPGSRMPELSVIVAPEAGPGDGLAAGPHKEATGNAEGGASSSSRPLLPRAASDGEEAAWIPSVLPPAFQVEDPKELVRAAAKNPSVIFVSAVGLSCTGRYVALGGGGWGKSGSRSSDATPSGLMENRRLLEEAQRERRRLQEELSRVMSLRDAAGEELGRVKDGLSKCAARRAELEGREAAQRAELARIEMELRKVASEAEEAEKRLAKAERTVNRLAAAMSALGRDKRALEERAAEIEKQLAEEEPQVRMLEEKVAAVRQRSSEARHRMNWKRQELSAVAEELKSLRWRAQASSSTAEKLEKEAADCLLELQQLERSVKASTDKKSRLDGELEALLVRREKLEDHLRRLGAEVEAARSEKESLVKELSRRRAAFSDLRLNLARVDAELAGAVELAESRLGTDWSRYAVGEWMELPERELEDRAFGFERSLNEMGPVNLLAPGELEEVEERLAFLKAQRADLVASLDSLGSTIEEIDSKCSQAVLAALDEINKHFQASFSKLFGGGSASLVMLDPGDPLESGVEIMVKVPGKKLRSIQLLSGGEKALTALALLVALFLARPSPICVLDEVDAPLDDANVDRFMELVREISSVTQVVLVTHNKRTMAKVDALVGVTMEEPGVSKLISVDLERAALLAGSSVKRRARLA